jgi:hypothetical protein
VHEIKILVKEQKRLGKIGPLDLTSDVVAQRQLQKQRSQLVQPLTLNEPSSPNPDGGGLMNAMSQLAWAKDIDLTKGKQFEGQTTGKDNSKSNGKAGGGGIDNPAFTKDSENENANNNDKKSKKEDIGTQELKGGGVKPWRSSKVGPDTNSISPSPDSDGSQGHLIKDANKGSKSNKIAKDKNLPKGRPPVDKARRDGSSGSKESKDSAFCEEKPVEKRKKSVAITGSRSSLNSASSLTSLLQNTSKDKYSDHADDF